MIHTYNNAYIRIIHACVHTYDRTDTRRWAAIQTSSPVVAEARSTTRGTAAAAAAAAGGTAAKGGSEKKDGSSSSRATKQGRNGGGGTGGGGGGGRKRRSRGRKGQDGWRKKGDFAKKEDLLHEMKWPKTRRKVE